MTWKKPKDVLVIDNFVYAVTFSKRTVCLYQVDQSKKLVKKQKTVQEEKEISEETEIKLLNDLKTKHLKIT